MLSDDDGVAVAVSGELGLPTVADARIEHGGWRGSTLSGCGISSVTTTRISTDDETHEVGNGESVDVVVDDNAMTFHAFSTFTYGPTWFCSDTNNRLSWALVRKPD